MTSSKSKKAIKRAGEPPSAIDGDGAAVRPSSIEDVASYRDHGAELVGSDSYGTLRDFIDGAFALTLSPAATCSDAERAVYFTEILPLRKAMMDEHHVDNAFDGMLIDQAVAALFHCRLLSSKATALLSSGHLDQVRSGEIMDKAAHRAHGRFITALELLHRGKGAPVRLEVEAVEQLHLGDQVIAFGSGGTGRR